ncbi:MAG: ferritin family protein [candidate division Zixibacteria bacterium]|nr:ferritin family protein [candidate division Zixibacteria bacterium]
MDIIEFAMKMETDGKAFYEKQATLTSDPELKKILLELAEEEGRHYEYFRRLKDNPNDLSGGEALAGSETLANVRNIFEVLAQKTDQKPFGNDVVSAWREARTTEEKSEAFYKEKAGQESNPNKKKLLLRIAKEENNHKQMIDGVLMFLRQPADFAQSAQFRNFQSLEGR